MFSNIFPNQQFSDSNSIPSPGTGTGTGTGRVRELVDQIELNEQRNSHSNTPNKLSRANSLSNSPNTISANIDQSTFNTSTLTNDTPSSTDITTTIHHLNNTGNNINHPNTTNNNVETHQYSGNDVQLSSSAMNNDGVSPLNSSTTTALTAESTNTPTITSDDITVHLKHCKRQIDYILSSAYHKLTIISSIGTPNNDHTIERYIQHIFHSLSNIALNTSNNNDNSSDVINTCKILYLTSVRLYTHVYKQVILHQIVLCLSTIIQHNISKHNSDTSTPSTAGLTLIQQLLASLARPDALHDNTSVTVLQHALHLLASLCVQLKSPYITNIILPALISRFSVNTRFIDNIVTPLARLAVDVWTTQYNKPIHHGHNNDELIHGRTITENQFDSIILLLLRAYSNSVDTESTTLRNNNSTQHNQQATTLHPSESASSVSAAPVLHNITPNNIQTTESVSDLYQIVRSTSLHTSNNNVGNLPLSQSTSTLVRNNSPANQSRLTAQQLNEFTHNTNTLLRSQIPYAVYSIAEHVHDIQHARTRLLIRLIRYCNECSIDIIHSGNKHELFVNFLPSISVLMNSLPPHSSHTQPVTVCQHNTRQQPQHTVHNDVLHSTIRPYVLGVQCFESSEKNIKWFRRFWYYITMFDITRTKYSTLYSMSLIRYSIQIIASYSPVLLMTNQLKPLNSELELALERSSINHKSIELIRSRLNELLPRHTTQLQQFTTAKLLFLYALYTLEYNRASSTCSQSIQCGVYYSSDNILDDSDMKLVIDAISDMIYKLTLETQFSYQPSYEQTTTMTYITNQLLMCVCSRYSLQRNTAMKYIQQLMRSCPQIQYSTSFDLLLTLYSHVQRSIDTNIPLHSSSTSELCDKSIKLELSDLLSDRQSVMNDVQLLLKQWTYYCSEHTPTQLHNILCQYWHKYVYNDTSLNTMYELQQHQGIQYVMSILPASVTMELMGTISTHQHYSSTAVRLYDQHGTNCIQSTTLIDSTVNRLIDESTQLYTSLSELIDIPTQLPPSTRDILYTAGALLNQSNINFSLNGHQQQQLMNIIVLHPLQLFNHDIVNLATCVWSWLSSMNDILGISLYVNIYNAWKYTVDHRMGLFSKLRYSCDLIDKDTDANNITIGLRGVNDDINSGDLASLNTQQYSNDIELHSKLIDWIIAQSTPVLHGMNRDIIRCIYDICLYSLQHYSDITTTPHSFGCQIRLFDLTLKLLHYASKINVHDKFMLRTVLYDAMLYTYSVPASWYTQSSRIKLGADIALANDVLNMLHNESKFIQSLQAEYQSIIRSIKSDQSANTLMIHTPGKLRQQVEQYTQQCSLLYVLLEDDIQRIKLWNVNTQYNLESNTARNLHKHEYIQCMNTAWSYDPGLAIAFARRFNHVAIVQQTCESLCQSNMMQCISISDTIPFLITQQSIQSQSYCNQLKLCLYKFCPTSIPTALQLLLPPYNQHQFIYTYAINTLKQHEPDNTVYYISQLVQLLRHDIHNQLASYVESISTRSVIFSHQFIWIAQAELGTVTPVTDKQGNLIPLVLNPYQILMKSIIDKIIQSFTPLEQLLYRIEFDFFEQVTSISGVLKPLPSKEQRKQRIRELLSKIHIQPGIYLPINPKLQVDSIVINSGTPMQSAAKVPILVAFKCKKQNIDMNSVKQLLINQNNSTTPHKQLNGTHNDQTTEHTEYNTPAAALSLHSDETQKKNSILHVPRNDSGDDETNQHETADPTVPNTDVVNKKSAQSVPTQTTACIFKVGDDTRQDALALQIMSLCQAIWQSVQLPLHVYPYRVVPTSTGSIDAGDSLIGGVIECIPNASTRDEIGKATACSLHDYYLQKFGSHDTVEYQQAIQNYIHSTAAYSIISYILQVKDRHNGNIMIDGNGYSLHIDFGFIFDISPANNLKFEKAGFKLTYEMIEMFGGVGSTLYNYYTSLIIRGMLAIRPYASMFDGIIYPMTYSDLACFRLPTSASDFHQRLFPQFGLQESIKATQTVIQGAYDSYRTTIYDMIQNKQQQIYYWNKNKGNEEKQADE